MRSLPEIEQIARDARIVCESLVAVGTRRIDALDLHRRIPVAGCRDGPGMRAETDKSRIATEFFSAELTDIQLAAQHSHLGERGVSDMRVVRPDDGFRILAFCVEQVKQR